MGTGEQGTGGVAAAVAARAAADASGGLAAGGGWEAHLPAALRLSGIPSDVQSRAIAALGAVGVESEFFLRLIRDFPGHGPHAPAQGVAFLAQLEAWSARTIAAAAALEVATQGYLAALASAFPALPAQSDAGDVWWAPLPPLALGGEALELRLRRCGIGYRHVVAVRLASIIETIAEHLAQVLQALLCVPPAGVLPAATLYGGLAELATTFQGYLVPYYILGQDERTPGLLPAISRLRQLEALDPPTLASDIAWAQEQYTVARLARTTEQTSGLVGEGTVRHGPLPPGMLREWQATIAALEALRGSAGHA
jgi:hypothetical protein